jgi:hypothetical protein
MAMVFFPPQAQYFDHDTTGYAAQPEQPRANQLDTSEIEHCMNAFEQFTLAPLSAGDIIDRAIRLYRRHFLVFLRIVLAPSLIAFAGGVLAALGLRNLSFEHGDRRMLLATGLIFSGSLLWLAGKALFLMLLGGAARSVVWHFFNGAPLKARDAYRAVRERGWSLLGATLLVGVLLLGVLLFAYTAVSFVLAFYFIFAVWLLSGLPQWLQFLSHALFGTVIVGAGIVLLLLTYARVIYVPQAMMVEGKGILDAIGRSFRLAGREIKRIAALVLFQLCVAMSIYWLLMIPLGWYGYWHGVDVSPFSTTTPFWYNIAQQTLAQIGEILIAPIVLLGFTLLYLDTRVRREGFDVELLANRLLPSAHFTEAQIPPVETTPAPTVPEPAVTPEPAFAFTPSFAESFQPATPIGEAVPRAASFVETVNVAPTMWERQPEMAATSASTVQNSQAGAGLESFVTIPLQQPREFAEVVPLAPSAAEPAVQTIKLNLAAQAEEIAALTRFCPGCGTQVIPGTHFCLDCGESF